MNFFSQTAAFAYRRILLYLNNLVYVIPLALFFVFLNPICLKLFVVDRKKVYTTASFSEFDPHNLTIGRIKNENCTNNFCYPEINDIFKRLAYDDAKINLNIIDFDNMSHANQTYFELSNNPSIYLNMPFIYIIYENTSLGENTSLQYDLLIFTHFQILTLINEAVPMLMRRAFFKLKYGYNSTDLYVDNSLKKVKYDPWFKTYLTPLVIESSIATFTIIILVFTVNDVKTEKRPYYITIGMNRFSYWCGICAADLLVSFIITFALVLINYFLRFFNSKDLFVLLGFMMLIELHNLMFIYFISWTFSNVIVSVGLYLSLMAIFIFIPWTIAMSSSYYDYAFCPVGSLLILMVIYVDRHNTDEFTVGTYTNNILYLMSTFVFFILLILFCEWLNKRRRRNNKKISEAKFNEFLAIKAAAPRKQEAMESEEQVRNSNPFDYFIRIVDVCKHFKVSPTKDVYAVNNVSIGIKEGTMFGLLGSNGAGKTTLMSIILKQLPLDAGSIIINGEDIFKEERQQTIGYCPQFPTHLDDNLTIAQTFKFFSIFYAQPKYEQERMTELLLNTMNLNDHKNKKIKHLSAGLKQQLCVCIPFLSDARTIILDEPTSVLDPISRRKVHHLINMYKGVKTFILCTHMLEEAEYLCDQIAIMIDGCLNSIGTPAFFTSTYGKDWKFDLMLESEDDTKVSEFIGQQIPNARLMFSRHHSRIYSVPSSEIKIAELFSILNNLKHKNIGVKQYTCTSSSLEKVFLNLVESNLKKDDSSELSDDPKPL